MSKVSKKDLISMIKTEANSIDVPDLKSEIRSKIPESNTEIVANQKTNKFRFNLSLSFSFVFILLCTLAIIFPFMLDNNLYESESPNNKMSKSREVFAMQATSLFSFASTYETNLSTISSEDIIPLTKKQEVSEEISSYLQTVEDVFNKDKNEYKIEVLEDNEYKYKISIELTLGESNDTYSFYFNETPLNNDDDEDDDLDEISSKIDGLISNGKEKYYVSGQKEVEKDECEVELTLYLNKERSDYIEVIQETENRENEYSYNFYKDNLLYKEIEMELTNRADEKVIELEKVDHVNNINKEYEFVYLNDQIRVEFEDETMEFEIIVKVSMTIYTFTFMDGESIEIDRENKKIKNNTNNTNKNEDLIVL